MVLWRQRNIFDLIRTLHLLLNIMGPKRRCSIKSYALKSRYLGLTVQEKRKASTYRRWIRQLIIIQAVDGGAEAADLEEVQILELFKSSRCPKIFDESAHTKSHFFLGTSWGAQKKSCANTLIPKSIRIRNPLLI